MSTLPPRCVSSPAAGVITPDGTRLASMSIQPCPVSSSRRSGPKPVGSYTTCSTRVPATCMTHSLVLFVIQPHSPSTVSASIRAGRSVSEFPGMGSAPGSNRPGSPPTRFNSLKRLPRPAVQRFLSRCSTCPGLFRLRLSTVKRRIAGYGCARRSPGKEEGISWKSLVASQRIQLPPGRSVWAHR